MRYLSAIGFTCLVLLLVTSVVSADSFPIAQNPGECIIHSQRPDPDDHPVLNWSSTLHQGTIVANDWLCTTPGPILEVHWWGSYLAEQVHPDGFNIWEWSHTGPTPWSTPDTLICTPTTYWNYQVAQVPGTSIWEYYIPDWDCDQYGDPYFLSIQAVYNDPDPNYDWSWHAATDVMYDYSVQDTGSGWEHVAPPEASYRDVAFELSAPCDKPEPATLSLLVTGLAALGLRLRRKKDS